MSHTKKKYNPFSVPSDFKHLQNRSQKQRIKKTDRVMFANTEGEAGLRLHKSHKWEYF